MGLNQNVCMLTKDEKIKIIGKQIAKYRKERGLTQNQLSEILDIYREHLAKIETAKRGISLGLVFEISEALNISEKDLFNF